MTAKRLILFCAVLASLLQADEHPFSIGETLEFDLKVNIIKAGHAKLQVIGALFYSLHLQGAQMEFY